ncbi:sodium:solute symporter [Colwellia sp. 4_MG-2023]|jgi:SSS family transporter|uniref:sodium:solute symporter n=1 Tax=unclassified Colwellia TaxID=196834 RepID=UPI001C07F75E|nr:MULTISPECIES: sodium:solute symporter [unclassified Colwellia]MBU2923140.1 sodium:solute symporter [Colwellia sp. C2M11]MDO6488311.1 sodium:solute symporter [Colwellia sp. 6_MG-2023]MDO6508284.1 sodium:solute symporter [Colwellia sp. 5_MG-2023]MDO6556901.1 sodium:solute symporter [Colwellia sp. 4_MG-2023]MDO6651431.1 sodium:solute symporter [Colwellia sp. 3_MG-2023]
MSTLYSGLDWLVFGLYGAMLLGSGLYFNRKKSNNTQDFFLGGNTIPTWMVAISILATSQSAATFLGGPDQGYQGDLSYLATNIGAIIAAVLVTVILVPKFYQNKVFTVYELLEKRMGSSAKKQAGIMYLFGRIFASGARLYMAALAVAMILFGNIDAENVIIATIILTLVGLLYTVFSGIRTVIYSDVIQCAVYVSAAVFVIYFIYTAIPASFSQIVEALQHPAPNAPSKLALFKFDWDFSSAGVFNFWSAITGFMLLNFAAFGLDQDMTQRILTCKNAKEANKAMLLSVLLVIPVMLLFIVIGLLLFILYQRPDIMQMSATGDLIQSFQGEKITIFMYYVLNEIPSGVRGLVTIGIIAAALSTLNSGLNSMSSVIVNDLYRPFKEKQTIALPESHYVKAGQVGMIVVAGALCLMAILCFYWQRYTDMPLLKFALSVMVFSYSGLLGVYFTALFTQRGNASSVFWALMIGFIVTLFFQPYVMSIFLPQAWLFDLGFTWQLCIGSFISLLVCMLGRNKKVVDNNLTASLDS